MNARVSGLGPAPEVIIAPHHVEALAKVARDVAGIRLTQDNVGFLTRRLPHVIAARGERSVAAYVHLLGSDESAMLEFIEALTIHTTSFFREERQYRWLQEIGLPKLVAERSTLMFWSAAASTGPEGWTALMVADQFRRSSARPFRTQLVGTDISPKVIAIANRAVYKRDDVEGVPQAYLKTYFMQAKNSDGRVRIVPELRAQAEWRVGNLSTGEGLTGIQADVAFLRNVLIYFSAETQAKVIARVVKNIRPSGYLLTGHSETGVQHPDLIAIEPSIYQRKSGQ